MPFIVTKKKLSQEQREAIRDFVVLRWLDNSSVKDLQYFFTSTNGEMLDEMNDGELIDTLEDNTTDEEFKTFFENRGVAI